MQDWLNILDESISNFYNYKMPLSEDDEPVAASICWQKNSREPDLAEGKDASRGSGAGLSGRYVIESVSLEAGIQSAPVIRNLRLCNATRSCRYASLP
jgi:hypothetical protein